MDTDNREMVPDAEGAAWAWLVEYAEQRWAEVPEDCTFSADQMVDAHMAGASQLSGVVGERVEAAYREGYSKGMGAGGLVNIEEDWASSAARAVMDTQEHPNASSAPSRAHARRLRAALKPFADCVDQIADDEDDEEWAKFRLLIKDYRRARAALNNTGGQSE